jgi:hypothetical protein
MGGGAINIGFGHDARIIDGNIVHFLAVTASVGNTGNWFDDSPGPRHECVDLSIGYDTLDDFAAGTAWKRKALLSAVKAGVGGSDFESLFTGLFGTGTLAAVQALDESDESHPITGKVFELLSQLAELEA